MKTCKTRANTTIRRKRGKNLTTSLQSSMLPVKDDLSCLTIIVLLVLCCTTGMAAAAGAAGPGFSSSSAKGMPSSINNFSSISRFNDDSVNKNSYNNGNTIGGSQNIISTATTAPTYDGINSDNRKNIAVQPPSLPSQIMQRGGGGLIPGGYNPFGYKITPLGESFLQFGGILDSDIGRFLASVKTRKTLASIKAQWLEIVRVSKQAQSMRIYRTLQELIDFCLKARFLD